jgi:antiviral helicase SKI2
VLSTLKKLSCTICSTDIEAYYELSSRIVLLGHQLRERIMRNPVGVKAATVGRVVVVNSGFYRNAMGVIVKAGNVPPPTVQGNVGIIRREAVTMHDPRAFIVLVVVEKREETKASFVSDLGT